MSSSTCDRIRRPLPSGWPWSSTRKIGACFIYPKDSPTVFKLWRITQRSFIRSQSSMLPNTRADSDGTTRLLGFNGHPPIERSLLRDRTLPGFYRTHSNSSRRGYKQPIMKMQVSALKSKAPSFVRQLYRRSRFLQWAHGLTLRNHWRELHTRDSCVYGFVNPGSILLDLIQIEIGTRSCDGRTVDHLEAALASIFGVSHLTTFSSGRNSLRAILKAMGIGAGDEVIIPGLTCVVVPYTILHCGARPVYVDIGHDYRMNLARFALRLPRGPKLLLHSTHSGFRTAWRRSFLWRRNEAYG